MDDLFILTDAHIESAATYLPLATKGALAAGMAELCVEQRDVKHDDRPVPPYWVLNPVSRELCLLGVLCKHYLKLLPQDGKLGVYMSTEEYDYYAGHHIRGQVNHFASSAAFDLLSDFRDFEDMLDACIQSELDSRNEPCGRLMAMMDAQTTPEAMTAAMGQLKAVGEEVKSFVPVATLPDGEFAAAE